MYARVHLSQFHADRRGVKTLRNCARDAAKRLDTYKTADSQVRIMMKSKSERSTQFPLPDDDNKVI